MLSYKVSYNGTTFITRNESLGSPELDDAASNDYKNATSYAVVMTALGGKVKDAWDASLTGSVMKAPSISDAHVEVVDGYLHITGVESFAPIVITEGKIVRNGETLWEESEDSKQFESAESADNETLSETTPVIEEKPIQPIEEPVKPAEEPVNVIKEPAATASEQGLLASKRSIKVGLIPGKNGKDIKHTYPEYSIGLSVVENPNPKRLNIAVGNDNWKRPVKVAETVPAQAKDTEVDAAVTSNTEPTKEKKPKVGNSKKVKEAPVRTQEIPSSDAILTKEELHDPIYGMDPIEDTSKQDASANKEPEMCPTEDKPTVTSVPAAEEANNEHTQSEMTANVDKWSSAMYNFGILPGEVDEVAMPASAPIEENDLGTSAAPVVEEDFDYPEWLEVIPKALLKNLQSFSARNIADEVIDSDYVLVEHWDKMGSWYATDVVDSATRIFYNSTSRVIYRTAFSTCKKYLAKVGNE